MAPVGAGMGASSPGGSRSMYADRVFLSHITSDPDLGQDKVKSVKVHVNLNSSVVSMQLS